MDVIADFCIVPIGVGVSVSKYIAECEKVFLRYNLKTKLHSYGTNLEGEWDEVFKAVKECHVLVHSMGAPRITSTLRFGTRTDKKQTMEDKINSVKQKLGKSD